MRLKNTWLPRPKPPSPGLTTWGMRTFFPWFPIPAAAIPFDSYECRHGLGYSRWLSAKGGIWAELTAFVPLKEAMEVNRLVLTNTGKETRTLDLFSYVGFCPWHHYKGKRQKKTPWKSECFPGSFFRSGFLGLWQRQLIRDIFHITQPRAGSSSFRLT